MQAESLLNKDKVFCPVYEVWNSRYACAKRYSNANQAHVHPHKVGGAGSGDLACRECEIGRQLFEAGFAKKTPVAVPEKEEAVGEVKQALKRCIKCDQEKPAPVTAKFIDDELTLVLDFSSHPEALEALAAAGIKEFRTVEGQAMYILTQAVGGK